MTGILNYMVKIYYPFHRIVTNFGTWQSVLLQQQNK